MMYAAKNSNNRRRAWSLLLALCMALSLCPALTGTADAAGESAMDRLINWGVVGGYPDGSSHPERSLTRAEFTAMVNRAYGYTKTGEAPFIDVDENAWYYDDIGIAYNANYFNGVSPRMAGPDQTLTRETAMVLLARNMRLDPIGGEVVEFSDGRSFASWSRGYARAAAQMGLIDGYGDGSYRPQSNITRGEMAELLQRALGTLVNRPGTHTLGSVYGNVTVNTPNATLRDATIAGNLYITGGLGLGDVTLENVRVLGDIIVAGGGSSVGGSEGIVLRNVAADNLLVDSIADQLVSLRAEGNTDIAETLLRSDAYVQDRTRTGLGLRSITLESPDESASFTLSGNLGSVVNKTAGSTLNLGAGTLQTLTVDESAAATTLDLASNTTIKTLNLDAAASVTGAGDVGALRANVSGSTTTMLPDTVTIRDGQTATVAGTQMTPAQAQESSLDPRLLAGYPKVTNLAPTAANAVFSANKPVTIYWALSYALDVPRGGFTADELITPITGDNRIRSSGNLSVTAAEAEVNTALSGLTADIEFTLSAVAVDSRGMRSPVKTVEFRTPDNTVPAFNSGYPAISQLTDSYAQITVMPNKTCTLYYALYYNGAAAPTAEQLRAGGASLTGSLRSGSMGVTKNTFDYPDFSDLNSDTAYMLYLCLSDGTRTSAVRTLAITTVSNTKPQFNILPVVTGKSTSSFTLLTNVDTNCTLYWAVVPAGTVFPQEPDADLLNSITNPAMREDRRLTHLVSQIISGNAPCVANGTVTGLGALADKSFVAARLQAGTRYDLYFVAQDAASGNYSDIQTLRGQTTDAAPAPTITLSAATLPLASGASVSLNATVANAPSTYSIVWESNRTEISLSQMYGQTVTVSNKNSGDDPVTATVSATVVQGSSTLCSATCSVTAAPPVRTPTLTLNKTSLNLSRGSNNTITATVRYLTGDYTVVWQSSNPDIYVSAFGETATVTGVAAGTAKVTATVLQGSNPVPGLTATCTVEVT